MTAITIQSNKIVSNELKETKRYESHCTEKSQMNFLANPIIDTHKWEGYWVT